MSDFTPPNLNTGNLRFDDFHPLDHTLRGCTGYPGGRRRHLNLWWDYLARPTLHAHTLCRIGLHKPALIKGRNTPHDTQWYCWDGCTHCHKPLSARQPL